MEIKNKQSRIILRNTAINVISVLHINVAGKCFTYAVLC